MDWQPKATMPKDGSKFFSWCEGDEWPEVIFWDVYDADVAEEVGEVGYFRFADDLLADVAEVEYDLITGWAPLPSPPMLKSTRETAPAQPVEEK
jgi:hypothetical protein